MIYDKKVLLKINKLEHKIQKKTRTISLLKMIVPDPAALCSAGVPGSSPPRKVSKNVELSAAGLERYSSEKASKSDGMSLLQPLSLQHIAALSCPPKFLAMTDRNLA